jgi:hypothetical protein
MTIQVTVLTSVCQRKMHRSTPADEIKALRGGSTRGKSGQRPTGDRLPAPPPINEDSPIAAILAMAFVHPPRWQWHRKRGRQAAPVHRGVLVCRQVESPVSGRPAMVPSVAGAAARQ